MKKERGITLIALVVTIVVLLILAAIGVTTLLGDNGIINHSQNAKEDTEISEEKRNSLGITDTLLRLSVGIEDADDIIDDLKQAMK